MTSQQVVKPHQYAKGVTKNNPLVFKFYNAREKYNVTICKEHIYIDIPSKACRNSKFAQKFPSENETLAEMEI